MFVYIIYIIIDIIEEVRFYLNRSVHSPDILLSSGTYILMIDCTCPGNCKLPDMVKWV